MGKILKAVGMGILLIGAAIIAGPAGISLFGATISSGALIAAGVASALGGLASLAFAPKMPGSQLSRLNLSFETTTPRKAAFGTTALNSDLRYHESSGTNQEYIDYIVAVAAHRVRSIDEIWFEEKQAWTVSGGVTSTYTGYLTVTTRTEGNDSNYISINGGYRWGSSCRLTGCAYIHLRIKRTGADSKVESPLVNGLPSRITIIGEGMPLYDPRKDSTVGGSGSHRADNQATWGIYTDPDDCDNPALQLLAWLLGWKINSKLSVGCGVPAARIDMESFITAANICDESVTLSIGGTQKRYRTSGTASDSDDRMGIINTFLGCMNGTLRDSNGKLALTVMKNDLADYVLDFDEDDVLGEFSWNQTRGLSESYNKARGRYVDPSTSSLYQLVDYPEVGMDSPDGIERVMTVDLPYVEDGRRAQRIAKQVLERNQYRGMFSATFTAKALGCNVGDVVRISFASLGWTSKLFRVISQEIRSDGTVPLALVEENPAIYAWENDDSAPVTPTAPTIYNPLNNPFILGTTDAATTADWSSVTGTAKPEDYATRNVSAGTHSTSVAYSKGDFVRNTAGDSTYIAKQNVPTGIALTNTVYWDLFVQGSGAPGENAISASLTNASHVVATANDGTGGSYTDAGGTMRVFDGFIEKTTSGTVTYAKVGSGTWYSINSSGVYTITDPGSDTATCQFDASYSGVTMRLTYSIAKSKAGSAGADGTNGTNGTNGTDGAPGADGLSIAATVPVMSIACTFNGSIKSGQLPRSTQFIVYAGSTNVTSSATYSLAETNCNVTNNGGGSFTLTSVSADSAYFDVSASYGSKTITLRIAATKVRDGSSSSSASGTVSINNSSSYSGTQSGPFTLPVGPGGTVALNATLNYYVTTSSATMYGKWQYRTTPGSGSWTDVASEITGDTALVSEPGSLIVDQSISGPSSAANWEFQFIDRKSGGGTALDNGNSVSSITWGV